MIILLERPIKVGDRIEVANVSGDVVDISMRATTIVTNDNISIIVPNSQFISETVINWSHTDRSVRFNFPIHVSYREDPQAVRKLLLDIALNNPGVLKSQLYYQIADRFREKGIEIPFPQQDIHIKETARQS